MASAAILGPCDYARWCPTRAIRYFGRSDRVGNMLGDPPESIVAHERAGKVEKPSTRCPELLLNCCHSSFRCLVGSSAFNNVRAFSLAFMFSAAGIRPNRGVDLGREGQDRYRPSRPVVRPRCGSSRRDRVGTIRGFRKMP